MSAPKANGPRQTNRREFLRLTVAGVLGSAIAAACQAPAAPTPTVVPPAPTAAPPALTATTALPPTATTAPPTPTTAPQPTAAPAASPTAAAPIRTVRWQTLFQDDQAIAAARKYLDGAFAQQHPTIQVRIETPVGDWFDSFVAAIAAGTGPDVFDDWADWVTVLTDKGQVTDLEPLVKTDYTPDQLKDFYPWQWRDFSIPTPSGARIRFGMPRYVNLILLWYNKDLFDKAGVKHPDETWDHVRYAEAAIKLTKSLGTGKYGLFYPAWNWDRFWAKLDIWGGGLVDPSDNTKAAFDSDKPLAALEWSRKLLWDDKAMIPDSAFPQGLDYRLVFARATWAMGEDGLYPFDTARMVNKQFRWAYAHVPKGPTGQRKVLGTTDGFSIATGSEVQDAACELLKALSGKDFQSILVQATGRLPVRSSVLESWKGACVKAYPELADVDLDVAPKAMEMGYPGGRQFFKKDSEASDIIGKALEKVYIAGGTPVSYIKEVAAQVTKAMRA